MQKPLNKYVLTFRFNSSIFSSLEKWFFWQNVSSEILLYSLSTNFIGWSKLVIIFLVVTWFPVNTNSSSLKSGNLMYRGLLTNTESVFLLFPLQTDRLYGYFGWWYKYWNFKKDESSFIWIQERA
jgi:hypothetical protein